MSEITRLRLMYEDDPIVLSLIEWIEGEDDRRAALDEEIARLETDYKRQLSLRQRDLDHAKQVTETLRLREEHIAELERTMSALKAQLDRSRPNQWTTTNVKQFSATPIGSPRWVWKYEADGTFRVEEVRNMMSMMPGGVSHPGTGVSALISLVKMPTAVGLAFITFGLLRLESVRWGERLWAALGRRGSSSSASRPRRPSRRPRPR